MLRHFFCTKLYQTVYIMPKLAEFVTLCIFFLHTDHSHLFCCCFSFIILGGEKLVEEREWK